VSLAERVTGCLVGGARGDAQGAPVEFDSSSAIRARYGADGVTSIMPPGHFTDDTQMTLFTCEGLIRAHVRWRAKGICHPPSVIHRAYLRWLHTQGLGGAADDDDGWLVTEPRLHRQEAPGTTCLSALASGRAGTVDEPLNGSKGCGGVMRAAPVGLFVADDRAWEMGCDVAALTHGHPDGWQPAGALAVIVARLVAGDELPSAVRAASLLTSGGTRKLLEEAVSLAASGPAEPEAIEHRLGGGWVGDEALAIGVACALGAPSFEAGVIAAVNHSGDSDSTGSICGNILGAAMGASSLPRPWLDALDSLDVVETVASDLLLELTNSPSNGYQSVPPHWWQRYPGW